MFQPVDFIWLSLRQEAIDRGEPDAEPIPDDVLNLLRASCERLSVFYSGLDPGRRLRSADGYPGYLTVRCADWQVFVPWPLVVSFPGEDILFELIWIAQLTALQPTSNMCVSGSSASLGHSLAIGDLDFCQYIELPPKEIVRSAFTFTGPKDARILISATYGNHSPTLSPWDQSWPSLEALMSSASVAGAQRLMLEFLGQAGSLGLLPISTIVLASDFADHSRGAAQKSFVYQEAVVVPRHLGAPAPIWTLVAPEEIGRYITFLQEQIAHYRESKPVKAVKRMLSLARTIGLHQLADEALDLLLSAEAIAHVGRQRNVDIRSQFRRAGISERDLLCKLDASLTLSTLDEGAANVEDSMAERCRSLLDRFLKEIDELKREDEIGGGTMNAHES